MDLKEIQQLVQDAIDNGATSVEQVHRNIANMPLDALGNIGGLEEHVQKARDFQDKTIGDIYEAIRSLNQKVGEIAKEQLEKIQPSEEV